MTTTILHANVQRSRFAQHLLSALTHLLPPLLRGAPWPAEKALGAAEQAAHEASQVREMAHAYAKTDPGFAADLYAAAARHEGRLGN